MTVDRPHFCQACGTIFYVTVVPPLAEVERNGEVWGTMDWDISCPFCGKALLPYLGITEETFEENGKFA